MNHWILVYKKIQQEKQKYFLNYLEYSKKIKEIAVELLGKNIQVMVFGSIVRNEHTPNSDIDVLIISENLSSNWEENRIIRTLIKKQIDPFSPFEINLVRPEEYEIYYKNIINNDFKLI